MTAEPRVAEIIHRVTDAIPVVTPPATEIQDRAAIRTTARPPAQGGRRATWRPAVLAGAAVLATVVGAGVVLHGSGGPRQVAGPSPSASAPTAPGPARLPHRMAPSGVATDLLSDAPPGRVIALFRDRGDRDYVALAPNGRSYRRVDVGPAGAAAALAPDGLSIALGDPQHVTDEVTVVDVRTGRARGFALDPPVAARPLAWSADGRRVAFATQERPGRFGAGPAAIDVLDVESGAFRRVAPPVAGTVGLIRAAFGPAGATLTVAAGGPDGCVVTVVDPPNSHALEPGIAGCVEVAAVAVDRDTGVTALVERRPDGDRLTFRAGPAAPDQLPDDRAVPAGTTIVGWPGDAGPWVAGSTGGLREVPLPHGELRQVAWFVGNVTEYQLATDLLPGLEVVDGD
ncbi:hypothetical protein O7635_33100 [Asanoa sp. WMMD1127]|uniref:hypothetical protein n=1 Tax=Asanoa sp. WMMD1127 TaxID=3016107 RepID=UPI0024178811|nr:hypothetical protein [Asanoa sp. WMMD1127]MDG4826713.1 hypothetical protein [Asanoa sp. WMMD1127]